MPQPPGLNPMRMAATACDGRQGTGGTAGSPARMSPPPVPPRPGSPGPGSWPESRPGKAGARRRRDRDQGPPRTACCARPRGPVRVINDSPRFPSSTTASTAPMRLWGAGILPYLSRPRARGLCAERRKEDGSLGLGHESGGRPLESVEPVHGRTPSRRDARHRCRSAVSVRVMSLPARCRGAPGLRLSC